MKAISATFGLALIAAASSSSLAGQSGSARRASVQAPTQCRSTEQVLYSCRFGRSVGSVCGSQGSISYRYGPARRPAIDLAAAADWRNVHVGRVVGQGGGHQSHVRFSVGDHHYILFEGVDGSLATNPGRTYSGIHVARGPAGDRQVAHLQCRGGAVLLGSWDDVLGSHAPADVRRRGIQQEERDGPFDAWF